MVIYKVEYLRVERLTGKSRDLQRVSLKSSVEYFLVYTHEEITQEQWEKNTKKD